MHDGGQELAHVQLAIQHAGHQQGVHHRDRRRFHRREDAGADADEDQRDQAQAGQRGHRARRHRAPARERLHAVAATARHHVAGDHQHHRHQQRRHDTGREQVGDRKTATGRCGKEDQVVRWRHQQRDQRGGHADIDREVAVVTALDHLRDHRAADRGNVGDCGPGHPAEKQRGQDRHLPQAAAQAADQRRGQRDQAFGNAAAHHDLAGEDEQRDRDQRRRAGAGGNLLDQHHRRQAEVQQGGQRGSRQRERHRHADDQQQGEHQEEQGDRHQRSPSCGAGATAAGSCGPNARASRLSANTTINAPPIESGR